MTRDDVVSHLRAGTLPDDGSYIARSASILRAQRIALALAVSGGALFITGESGTGKTSLVRWVSRCLGMGDPVVRVCSRGSDTEWDDIIGHNRGAYTGATHTRDSVLDHSGTVLLDEIAEAPDALQVQLLRIVQERKYRRAGSDDDRGVACGLIAYATHSPQRLRHDLRARLAACVVHLEPLHQRSEDIAPLVLGSLGGEAISPDALSLCVHSRWPGNNRALLAAVQRAQALAMVRGGERIEREDMEEARRDVVALVLCDGAEVEPMNPAWARVMRIIRRDHEVKRRHIQEEMMISKGAACSILLAMAGEGLIERRGSWYCER